MGKKIEYQITAHENGWAIIVSEVIKGVYPSSHLALAAAKLLKSDMMLPVENAQRFAGTTHLHLTDAAAYSRFRASPQPMVAVPYQVDSLAAQKRRHQLSIVD